MSIGDMLIVVGLSASLVVLYKFYIAKADKTAKTKEQKRAEILDEYKMELDNSSQEDRMELLKKFNLELSKNIFFDNSEIRDIIKELANYK